MITCEWELDVERGLPTRWTKDMDGATNSMMQCEVLSASRLIRGRWSWEERRRRRGVAEAKQRELWRLLKAARAGLAARQSTTVLADLPTESDGRERLFIPEREEQAAGLAGQAAPVKGV
jgi:hypothetical protein